MADTSTQLATLINGLNLNATQIQILTTNLSTLNQNELLELNAKVAAAEEGLEVTRRGFELLGKALAGKELCYTRVAYGNSEVNSAVIEPTAEEMFEFNGLINEKKECPILSIKFIGGGMAAITFAVHNDDVTEGFFIRETGIFARDPDTGEEILYCYRNTGVKVKWLPSSNGTEVWRLRVSATTAIANATNITAIIDAGLIYVTQEEFSEHINDTNPHPNTPTVQQTVTNTDNVLTYGEDNNFHPISLTDFTRQALGGDTADLPQIKSRISQAEVNIANIFMQLKAEEDLGLKPNLLLIDDFDNPTNTDFYRQNVVTSVAGISNVRVVSDVGLHSGSWYTLSDGVHNELVQVTAVAKNGDAHVAIFADDVINTYDLTCTQLYRTTTTPENSIGIGAGDTRSEVYPFTETWQGTSANSSATTYLNTTLANSAAFTLSGSYAFSADGEFTLA